MYYPSTTLSASHRLRALCGNTENHIQSKPNNKELHSHVHVKRMQDKIAKCNGVCRSRFMNNCARRNVKTKQECFRIDEPWIVMKWVIVRRDRNRRLHDRSGRYIQIATTSTSS